MFKSKSCTSFDAITSINQNRILIVLQLFKLN